MKISSALLTAVFALAAALGGATQGSAAPAKPSVEELRRNIEHWKSLPQSERDRIRQSYRRYQSFKPEQVSAVQDNFRKFRNMPAERRRELSKKLQGLPPQDRERVAQKLRELQDMGQDRRKMAIEFARLAHSLTPEQKRQLKELSSPEERKQFAKRLMREKVFEKYLQDLPADERVAFRSLQPAEQKRHLQKYFRERAMRGPPR
ncbi:MAG: hypothetical protein FD180_2340 [Planctomycetota bacterium]|nr:MAG: hypothetical protein FD180_2340 [Planctomycetota bacterium]